MSMILRNISTIQENRMTKIIEVKGTKHGRGDQHGLNCR
jgi:hypothetical protein